VTEPVAGGAEPAAEPGCIFCRIVAGTVPSWQVYADEQAVAFLDVAPWHRGHALVVPRRHVPDLVTGAPTLAAIAPAVDAVARLLKQRLAADGLNLLSSAGAVAGQEVNHLHIHLIPRYADEPGLPHLVSPGRPPEGELESVHAQLRAEA